jgi:tetratricopeptide (TPR) repeat protein
MSLEEFVENLQAYLPKARDKWTEEDRHESLRASFDFTMNSLLKTEEGKELQIALSRLSVFVGFFASIVAAPVIANEFPETMDEIEEQNENAEKISLALWKRGLLERVSLPLENGCFYLYRLHPVLRFIVKELLIDDGTVRANYWTSMSHLAQIAIEQRRKNPFTAQIAQRAVPDLLAAAEFSSGDDAHLTQYIVRVCDLLQQFGLYDDSLRLLKKLRDLYRSLDDPNYKALMLQMTAPIHQIRGDLDKAIRMYQQWLKIEERLGNLRGKSSALRKIAEICVTRGNLDRAMELYQQSRTLDEKLGDLLGKSISLHNMAQIFYTRGDLDQAMEMCRQSLEIEEKLDDLLGKSATLHQMAKIYVERGDLNQAMKMYQQSLEIEEWFGDLMGKSATLHGMAEIHARHGNLDEAMELCQQSLEIQERLGNLQGKIRVLASMASILENNEKYKEQALNYYNQALEISYSIIEPFALANVLAMMSSLLIERGEYENAVAGLIVALDIFVKMQDEPDIGTTIYRLLNARKRIGAKRFDSIWKEIKGQNTPDWLVVKKRGILDWLFKR